MGSQGSKSELALDATSDDALLAICRGLTMRENHRAATACSTTNRCVGAARQFGLVPAMDVVSVSAAGHQRMNIPKYAPLYPRVLQSSQGQDLHQELKVLGHGHSIICTTDGTWVFGCGHEGQLMLDEKFDEGQSQYTPRLVEPIYGRIVSVAAGSMHTVVINSEGQAFSVGNSGMNGHTYSAGKISVPPGTRLVGAAAGDDHTILWTDTGAVFSFGAVWNRKLEVLGHPFAHQYSEYDYTDDSSIFQLLHGAEQVEGLSGQVIVGGSAGGAHSLVWTNDGKLFSWGCGTDGQLGHGNTEDEPVPRQVLWSTRGKNQVQLPEVARASCGNKHSALCTVNGEVFTFGCGDEGMLGQEDSEQRTYPKLVQAVSAGFVVGVSSSARSTEMWTNSGSAYSAGKIQLGGAGRAWLLPARDPSKQAGRWDCFRRQSPNILDCNWGVLQ